MTRKLTLSERKRLIQRILNGESITSVAADSGVSKVTLHKWLQKLKELEGFSNLANKNVDKNIEASVVLKKGSLLKKTTYTQDEKTRAVLEVLHFKLSPTEVAKRRNISKMVLYNWISAYKRAGEQKKSPLTLLQNDALTPKTALAPVSFNEHAALSALAPKSRFKPERYTNQVKHEYEELILNAVKQYPELSSHQLVSILPEIGGKPVVGHHGVQNVLFRNDLNTYAKRLVYAQSENARPYAGKKWIHLFLSALIKLSHVPLNQENKAVSFWISFAVPVVVFLSASGFINYLRMFALAPSIGAGIGYIFSSVALFFGFIFFVYSSKYYFSVIIILLYSRHFLRRDGTIDLKNFDNNAPTALLPDVSHIELDSKPFISIQVPLYNEKRVVNRLLDALTSLNYENYEVIVCDDSTDETRELVLEWKNHPKIKISQRETREGFKGAALRQALTIMDKRTEFVIVFDADFLPFPDTIEQFLKYFKSITGTLDYKKYSKSKIAALQGYQWHVLNKSENWITRGVRTEYAGSYVIERSSAEIYHGLKQIAGSVFMIRADVIKAYNWGSSITEDFQLTLRLYRDGYRVLYTPYVQTPSECVSTLKRLVRQRMRWAEGHSFNIKKMFFAILFSPQASFSEKVELFYLAPYYLQSGFFLIGTLAWFIAEVIFQVRLPFWTAVWGWSLVLTNLFSLPLMNLVGMFLEEAEERDYAGLFSFILLTYIIAPFQAYAALKGFIEKDEGTWFRTPKTGKITDLYRRSSFNNWLNWIFGKQGALERRAMGNSFTPAYVRVPQKPIKNMRTFFSGKRVLAIFLMMSLCMSWFSATSPKIVTQVSATEDHFNTLNTAPVSKKQIDSEYLVKDEDYDVIFGKTPVVQYKQNERVLEIQTSVIGVNDKPVQINKVNGYEQGELISYYGVIDGLDLIYKTDNGKISESFLLDSYKKIDYIEQKMFLVGLVAMQDPDGTIRISSSAGGEAIFTFGAPSLYENADKSNSNNNVSYKLIPVNNREYILRKELHDEAQEWLSASERTYPVVIDPTIYRTSVNMVGTVTTANRVQWGSNERKIAYMPNATGGAAWYAVHAFGTIIRYQKCIASTGCGDDDAWSPMVTVDTNGDAGDYNPTVYAQGDTLWIGWLDEATAGGINAIDAVEFRGLDTTTDTFNTQCTGTDQGTLDNTNYVYMAVASNNDVIIGYSDTAGDAEADIFLFPNDAACGWSSIETGSGLPTGTTTMRPVAVALSNKVHILYDDAANEIRHSIYDVLTTTWDSSDTVADNGNVLNDIFSVTTDGSSLWLLYMQDATTTVLQKCASTCTTTWTNLTAPFTSSDLTSGDEFPNISYISSTTDLQACIIHGASASTQGVICKTSDSGTISWGSSSDIGFPSKDHTHLSMTLDGSSSSQIGMILLDTTGQFIRFASNSNKSALFVGTLAATETQFGSNQRKVAYMANASGGAAWYVFHFDANIIKYRKCLASTACDDDGDWGSDVTVDTNGDAGDYNVNIWVQGDTIWAAWIDDATAGGVNAIDSLEVRALDTTSDAFGTQCTSADQGTLDNTNFAYIAAGTNGDVVAGYSDTAGDAEADIFEIPTGTCTFTSIETGSGLPTGTTTMRPVAVGLGNKIHVVYDDAANEIRHSVRDVSSNAWDSNDTVADNGNVLDDIFSVVTDGSSLWLLYMQDATTSVLQKCASTCTTTWSNLTAPFTSSDLTSGADYPTIGYVSGTTELIACILNGSTTSLQDAICKTTNSGTISWSSSSSIGFPGKPRSQLSLTHSVSSMDQVALVVRDETLSNYRFATVPENLIMFLTLPAFYYCFTLYKRKKKVSLLYRNKQK